MSTPLKISADQTQSWLDQHAELEMAGTNLVWLNEQRKTALAQFEKVGLPGIRDEQWRYTNLRELKSNDYPIAKPAASASVELESTNNPRLVFVDGYLDGALSSVSSIDGLTFASLSETLSNNPDLIKGKFGS